MTIRPSLDHFCKLATLLFLFALGVSAQDFGYDLRVEGLNGKVKRVEEDRALIELKNGVPHEKSRHRNRTIIFDRSGRKTYEWSKVSGLDPFEHFYYYEMEKRIRRTVRPGPTGTTESYSYSIFSFDTAANSLFERVFPGREHEKRKQTQGYTYRFDDNGCVAAVTMLSPENKPVMSKDYVYETGCLVREVSYSPVLPNGRRQRLKFTYEMDDKGNWKKQTIVNTLADDNATTRTEVIYRTIEYYR